MKSAETMTSATECLLTAGPTFHLHHDDSESNDCAGSGTGLLKIKRSTDTDGCFPLLYASCCHLLCRLQFAPRDHMVLIQSGEGMLALWSALKSILHNRDNIKVLSISNGVYGRGLWEMCRSIVPQAATTRENLRLIEFDWRDSRIDVKQIKDCIDEFTPDLVTVVHCDTPCGSIIPAEYMREIGTAVHAIGSLFLVDFVSSCGGAVVDMEGWRVDVGCLGMQKCLALPPTICSVTLSPRVIEWIRAGNYRSGYDALLPWIESLENMQRNIAVDKLRDYDADCLICIGVDYRVFAVDASTDFDYGLPYTLDYDLLHLLWHQLSRTLSTSKSQRPCIAEKSADGNAEMLFYKRREPHLFQRWQTHRIVQEYTVNRAEEIGIELFITDPLMRSPTCTALLIPTGWTWQRWKSALAECGVYVSGGGGGTGDNIFRLGHMGPQASLENIGRAMDVISKLLQSSSQ